jgi:hypothetical protein
MPSYKAGFKLETDGRDVSASHLFRTKDAACNWTI